MQCPFIKLGFVGGKRLVFPKTLDIHLNEISKHWENGLKEVV